MSERDILIERLERKLAEKEKEIAELRRMLSDKGEIERSGVDPQILQKLSEIESKMLELRRAVESVVNEITYIKSELKELRSTREEPKDDKRRRSELKEVLEKIDTSAEISEEELSPKSDTILIADDKGVEEVEERKIRGEESKRGDDEDIIICD